jgi:uncharacterized protein (UPF0332 family)
VNDFLAKAEEAAEAARLLLASDLPNGAVSRAYCAMLFAARSELERVDAAAAQSKRHGTVIGRFALHFIRQQGLNPAHGRAFNMALDRRLIADYQPESIEPDVARSVVGDMVAFLAALSQLNSGRTP